MAHIINTDPKVETVTTVTEVITEGATIFLTQKEINALSAVLRRVGGSSIGSPREHTQNVCDMLHPLVTHHIPHTAIDPKMNRIFFEDYTY